MKTKDDIDNLQKLIVQLGGLHAEMSQLAKKSPNDALNTFKLKFVNRLLQNANVILTGGYIPFADFSEFDEDQLPTNSDVTMIIAQYMEQAERYRSDHVVNHDYTWKYLLSGSPSEFEAAPPTKVGAYRK